MATTIRLAQEPDTGIIHEMMRALYASERLSPAAGAFEALAVLLSEPALGCCFLLQEDDRIVGYGIIGVSFSLEFGGRDAFLDELFLIEEARGKGIGKLATQFAIDWCRAAGIQALHLEVSRKNHAAQRLYRGQGFRERHEGYDLLTLRIE